MIVKNNPVSRTVRYYISNSDKKVVSRVYLKLPEAPGKPLFLFKLKTNKKYRGKGLATALLKKLLKDYKKHDIELGVNSYEEMSIERLFEFYEKLGFQRKRNTKRMIRKATNDNI